jgi:2-hydroxychromene-2-carboxylate isomerase
MSRPHLDLWFDPASTYSYLAVMRAEHAAAAAGVTLGWRPFLLGPIFSAQLGIKDSPFNVYPARGRYMWRDLERLCERYGLPFRRPRSFPRNSVLAARVALVGASEPWGPSFVRALYQANFVEDLEIDDREVLGGLLRRLGQDPARTLAQAESAENKLRLREQTTAAEELGIFGAPTFVAGEELFWGHDRMADALAWCQRAAR